MRTKISSALDSIADRLEARGLVKEAYELDKVADEIDYGPGNFVELSKDDFERARVTSYTGGSTWLKLDGKTLVVNGKTPVDIEKEFDKNPKGTVRATKHIG